MSDRSLLCPVLCLLMNVSSKKEFHPEIRIRLLLSLIFSEDDLEPGNEQFLINGLIFKIFFNMHKEKAKMKHSPTFSKKGGLLRSKENIELFEECLKLFEEK